MDGVVEVLGLEHRRFQDAVEVDDLIGGGGVSLLMRTHDAWRARPRCRLVFPRVAELL